MPRCLFCLRERDQLTDEHVFPAALGGALVVPDASCPDCNNSFSKAFEQAVAGHFAGFRRLLLIPDRYGKVPELFVSVEADGQMLDAKLMPDGGVQLKPVVTYVKSNGVAEVMYQHPTKKQEERLRKEAEEKGLELIEEDNPSREVTVNMAGDLAFIDSPEVLRTVTKIAYTTLALRTGPDFAMRAIFSGPRTYVLTGNEMPPARLFLHEEFLKACAQGPHQHSVVLVGRNSRHSIEAIVRLFGALCYFVVLTEQYEGADLYSTLVYDAQRGEEDRVLVVNEQAEFLQVEEIGSSKETVWDDRVRSGEAFVRFLAQVMNVQLHE
jgi:hypothetical protein